MPVESASFIQNLNATYPTATDDITQGDNHIRLIKAALKATFPTGNRALYIQGARTTVASAETTNIGAVQSDKISITGTTTIVSFGTSVAGVYREGTFGGALTLTHGTIDLPTGDDIQTAAGDRFGALSLGDGNWIVLWFQRASGKALLAPEIADIAGLQTALDLRAAATPVGKMDFWPGAVIPNGWITAHGQAISRTTYAALYDAYGVVHGAGDTTTTFNVPDMRGKSPVGLDNMGGTSADVITAAEADTLGDTLGAEQMTLALPNVPKHGHPSRWGVDGGDNVHSSGGIAMRNTNITNKSAFTGTLSNTPGEQIGGAGGDPDTGETVPFSLVQPSLFGNWIIWTGVLSEE